MVDFSSEMGFIVFDGSGVFGGAKEDVCGF